MFPIFIVAIIATMSGSAVGKEVVEIGMVIETGCPFAKQVLVDKLIPEVKLFSKEGKNRELYIQGKVHYRMCSCQLTLSEAFGKETIKVMFL